MMNAFHQPLHTSSPARNIQDGLPEKATSVIVFKWLMSENIIPAVTSASTAMPIMMKRELETTVRFIMRILHF